MKNEEYIDINKIAELKGLKSNRSLRLAIQKGKYIAREVKVFGGKSYEILYSSLEPEIQEKLQDELIKEATQSNCTALVPLNSTTKYPTFISESAKLTALARVDIVNVTWMVISLLLQNHISNKMDFKVKSKYYNETIECVIGFPLWCKLLPQFCSGLVFGSFILPFFIFENVQQIKLFTTSNLFCAILYCIWSTLFFLSFCSHRIYLTNKRILSEQSLRLLVKLKLYNFLFSDVKDINYYGKNLTVKLNNGDVFDTGMKPNLKNFYIKFLDLHHNESK